MIRLLACAAALLSAEAAIAANPSPCLTRDEAGNLFIFIAPSAIEAAALRCGPTLPEGAYLRGAHAELVQRLRTEANRNQAGLRTILAKISGEDMPEGIRDETFRGLMEDVMGAEFSKDLSPQSCPAVNSLALALSPLPARNIGILIASIIELAGSDGKEDPLPICRAN
jgi:hypothetical protein